MRGTLILLLTLAFTPGLSAQDILPAAIEDARRDVAVATGELNAFRDTQAAARRPLTGELERLHAEVLRLRKDLEHRRQTRQQDQRERERLALSVTRLQKDFQFARGLLQEYRRSLETRMGMAESIALAPRLAPIDHGLTSGSSPSNVLDSVDALLRLAEEQSVQRLGGVRHGGTCLDVEGTERRGQFAVLGPATYFASEDGEVAGLVVSRIGSSLPVLFPNLEPPSIGPITTLVNGGKADCPIDVTGGDALRVAARRTGLGEHLLAGGLVMVPLLLIGAAALVLTAWKLLALRSVRTPARGLVEDVVDHLDHGRLDEARARATQAGKPFDIILAAGIDSRRAPREHLEELMHERVLSTLPGLDRHLGMLAVLGGVAPLLGLLGTVTGMIHTFEMVTVFGTGDARLLSGGISEALITTEIGLIIAVPVLLIHAYLSRRVKTLVSGLEQTAVRFVNQLQDAGEEPRA